MKKLLFFGLFVAVLMPVAHASADGFTALAPIPGLTSQSMIINSDSLAAFFNNLYKYLVGLAATIAVIQIMWAGAGIAFFHKDAVAAITDDKGKIYNAIFGLVLVLSPVLVFSIINPSILDLSLNMPPIKNNHSSSGASNGSQQSNTQAPTQQMCNGITYDQFKTVPVPVNKNCVDALGTGWVDASGCGGTNSQVDSACSGTNPDSNCRVCGLQSTNQDAACTITHAGPYLETIVCSSQDAATSFTGRNACPTGLTWTIPSCKTTDASSGKCLDTSFNAYCSGKTITLSVYQYYQYSILQGVMSVGTKTVKLVGNPQFVPRDAAAANAFASGCTNDGGKISASWSIGSNLSATFSTSLLVSNGCSSDYGSIPVDKNQFDGAACFTDTMTCDYPN